MSLLDKPFKEPIPGPWPVWVIALVIAFAVGTCQAHATTSSRKATTTIPTTTTTTVPAPRLSKTYGGDWPIAAPGYFDSGPTRDDRGIAEGFYSGTMSVEGGAITPDDIGAGGNFWCGPSGWEYNIAAASGHDHLCTWPELKQQGWVRGRQSKPTYSFYCGYDPCTAEQLKKAKYYEAGLHPLVTLPPATP